MASPPDRPLYVFHIQYISQAQSDHSILLANVVTSDNKQCRMIFGRMIDDVFWKLQIQSLEMDFGQNMLFDGLFCDSLSFSRVLL